MTLTPTNSNKKKYPEPFSGLVAIIPLVWAPLDFLNVACRPPPQIISCFFWWYPLSSTRSGDKKTVGCFVLAFRGYHQKDIPNLLIPSSIPTRWVHATFPWFCSTTFHKPKFRVNEYKYKYISSIMKQYSVQHALALLGYWSEKITKNHLGFCWNIIGKRFWRERVCTWRTCLYII